LATCKLEGCSGTANRKISRQRKAKVCGVEWARVSASSRFCASTSKKIAGANGLGMIDILAERQEIHGTICQFDANVPFCLCQVQLLRDL
jgi:hypothetical protein